MIKDHTSGCRSRVRINSGYSPPFRLRRGVRQGDPLSCLLYDFSLEPLGHRLRQQITGISVMGLPPAQVMMYADDTNLFLSHRLDDLQAVTKCLANTSYTIGCKFNLEKTDVLPVGSIAFRKAAAHSGLDIPGAYILPPSSPLRILGVWVGCDAFAKPRWLQILDHIKKLIGQWTAIGASILNRVLIAKLLMQSHCYYLLDGNGIPPPVLTKISNTINQFVRGHYSSLPYRMLAPPLAEGGLNFPSLAHRKSAYDLKFLGDLLHGNQSTLWKVWTYADLQRASMARPSTRKGNTHSRNVHINLDPLTQCSHIKYSALEPRLRQAVMTARRSRMNIQSHLPSVPARKSAPAAYHHALSGVHSLDHDQLMSRGISNTSQLVRPTFPGSRSGRFMRKTPIFYPFPEELDVMPSLRSWDAPHNAWVTRTRLLSTLSSTNWHPSAPIYCDNAPMGKLNIWQKQDSICDCHRIFTLYRSILAPLYGAANLCNSFHTKLPRLLQMENGISDSMR